MIVNDRSWYAVRYTPGATGLSVPVKAKPIPLTDESQTDHALHGREESRPKNWFTIALQQMVRLKTGPFAGWHVSGVVSEINEERGKLKVLVSMFDAKHLLRLIYSGWRSWNNGGVINAEKVVKW